MLEATIQNGLDRDIEPYARVLRNFSDEWMVEQGQARLAQELSDGDYYWGEIPRDEMRAALDEAVQDGWRKAVEERLGRKYPHLVNMVRGQDRVDWVKLLPDRPCSVLDVGSGWGQTSVLLASQLQGEVFSLEPIAECARFQTIRKQQEGLDNLHVINGSLEQARFRDAAFDLVTLIGVLEWIGSQPAEASPRDMQLDALRQIHGALKPGGRVCIGIENRIGYNVFTGAVDHSGLRFTSLMPRHVASLYMQVRHSQYRSNRQSKSYRTYTYTDAGFRQLLEEAGFRQTQIFVAHPHYAHPSSLVELDERKIRYFFSKLYQPSGKKDWLKAKLFVWLSRLGLAGKLAPYYILFGEK